MGIFAYSHFRNSQFRFAATRTLTAIQVEYHANDKYRHNNYGYDKEISGIVGCLYALVYFGYSLARNFEQSRIPILISSFRAKVTAI
jgi:hypothetical protein